MPAEEMPPGNSSQSVSRNGSRDFRPRRSLHQIPEFGGREADERAQPVSLAAHRKNSLMRNEDRNLLGVFRLRA